MYKLILYDGTEIDNLRMSGNNLVSSSEFNLDLFKNNLKTVTITGKDDTPISKKVVDDEGNISWTEVENEEEVTIVLHNAELIQQMVIDGEYYICFRELTERELKDIEVDSKIEYIAMMTDIDM